MSDERSPWFYCAKQQPSRVGFYEVFYDGDKLHSGGRLYWSGDEWWLDSDGGIAFFGNQVAYTRDKWRGLAEKP